MRALRTAVEKGAGSGDPPGANALCVGDAIVTVGGARLDGLTGPELVDAFEAATHGQDRLDLALLTPPDAEGARRELRVMWGEGAAAAGATLVVDRRDCAL